MIKIMRRLLSSLLLFGITGAAWASDFTAGTAVENHTDLSVAYLSQVFGTVGNVLQSSTGQMLGQLFYKFNEGVIIVAGLWLAYTVFTIVIRSAQEGSFMGANKNVALVFLKIAVGFSLLIPNPSTGYSVLQDVVMKVVVQGVGLADQTWNYGLQYIANGGTVWHRPETSIDNSGWLMNPPTNGNSNSIISTISLNNIIGGSTSDKKGPGQQIFADEVCMYSSNDNQTSIQSNTNINTGPAVSGTPAVQYDVITDDANSKFEFPGVGNPQPLGPGSQNCGSVSWNIQSACAAGPSSTQCVMAKQGLYELVMGLEPAAKKYYCSQHANAASCIGMSTDNVASDNEQTFFSSLANYLNIITPLVEFKTTSAQTAKQFITQAETEGWMSAGRYYWDLSQVQTNYDNISGISNYIPVNATAPTLSGNPLSDANNALSDSLGYIGPIQNTISNYNVSQSAGDTGAGTDFSPGSLPPIVSSLVGGVFGDITNLIQLFGTPGAMNTDPIEFLHKVGMSSIGIAGDIWFGFLGLMVGVLVSMGVCNAEWDMSPAVRGAVDWIKPLMTILAGAFWGAGFVLGFYVPMYPYIIYTFGVIGWIIAVIEAMVAAPLICFGLTHPEGHDFLGEAKQAGMLLLSVFLRPALMVMGLIGAMILSYVSLRLLIYTFSGFATDLFYISGPLLSGPSSGGASGSILGAAGTLMNNAMHDSLGSSLMGSAMCLLVFPLTLIVFTTLVYLITTQCFSLIFALPDNILRWIGGPQHASQAAQMAQQLQGTIGGAANTFGKGVDAGKQEAQKNKDMDKLNTIVRQGRGE